MPRVMIVEDDLIILNNISQLLRLNGLTVIEAHDGQMALSLLHEQHRKGLIGSMMIVSDFMMPKMDGFELLKAVRSNPSFQFLPFVLLSARSDVLDMQQAFALGANDYLVKPFEVEQLLDVIRHQLSSVEDGSSPLSGQLRSDFFLE